MWNGMRVVVFFAGLLATTQCSHSEKGNAPAQPSAPASAAAAASTPKVQNEAH